MKTSSIKSRFVNFFVNKDEKEVAVLGNSYAASFLSGGGLARAFAVVTDRRVYFNGNAFVKSAGSFNQVHREQIVDLEDVTGTGFDHYRSISLLVLSIIFTVLIVTIPIAIFTWIGYFSSKKTFFSIEYAGGLIFTDASWFDSGEARNFQRVLRLAKDARKDGGNISASVSQTPSAADKLLDLAAKLDAGEITQDDFAARKGALLGAEDVKVEDSDVQCPGCKKWTKPGANFCRHCGHDM